MKGRIQQDEPRWNTRRSNEASHGLLQVKESDVRCNHRKDRLMSLGTILLIILVLALLGVLPAWPHSRSWGYGPSGLLGVLVVVLVVLFLMGQLHF